MSDTETLQLILSEIQSLKRELDIFKPDLTIEKEVVHFLQKEKRTVKRYIDDGILIEGVHYYNDNDKRIYVPDEIIAFKKSGCRPPLTNPKAQAVLKHFGL
jgi:uridine kinase